MTLFSIIVALLLLFLGQRLYWVFVGAIGFLLGMDAASEWITGRSEWFNLLIGLFVGVVGALLAIFFQRIALGIAGFFAGGHLTKLAMLNLVSGVTPQTVGFSYFVGGIIVAFLIIFLLDWALVCISSLLGAAIISQAATQDPQMRAIVLLVLFLIGAGVQSTLLRRRRLRLQTTEPV